MRSAVLVAALWVPAFASAAAAAGEGGIVRIVILAGQSNMEGQGVVDLDHPEYYNGGKGTLERVIAEAKNPGRFAHLKDADGGWTVRDDVFVRFRTAHGLRKGGLTVGFTGYEGRHHIGPELQIGHVLGDQLDDPVLLVKTAWGGKSLHRDFRPPSADGDTGPYFLKMIEEVEEAVASMADDFPELAGRKPEFAAFIWFQGWNDMVDEAARAEYEENLVLLAGDVREALGAPALPIVIGELGNLGADAGSPMQEIRQAQAAAARRIEPTGSAVFVETHGFARPKEDSPNVGHGHHWFGNAESYFLIGDALGRAAAGFLEPSRR